jgi:hypothetical protein
MLKSILKSWKENRGNLLLILGSVAGLVMSLVWYFELVPEITLVTRNMPGTLVSTGPRVASSSLVGIVRAPARQQLPESAPTAVRQAVVEVYPPSHAPPENLSPLLLQTVELRDDGGPVAVVFNDLPPGKYAAVAYIDLNDNGRFDIEELGVTNEPFCLGRLAGPPRQSNAVGSGNSDNAGDQADASPAFPAGVFELDPHRATLIVFDFDFGQVDSSGVSATSEKTSQPTASPEPAKQ